MCIPACNGQGDVYLSMQWAGCGCIPACNGGVCVWVHSGVHPLDTYPWANTPTGQTPPRADTSLGRHPWWTHTPRPNTTYREDTPPGRHLQGRHCPANITPTVMATEAGGMHPTGMHSCLTKNFEISTHER